MSNSGLVDYIKISPNRTSPRRDAIRKITIHHMAGNLTVEGCGSVFAPTSRQASSNYGIGSDGRVGMYVEEKDRSWCSSSGTNDHQAVTIEVADDVIGNGWHSSDKAMAKLIDLCTDICKRNGIAKLNYTGDASGNLTMHKWFAATDCPGAFLESKFPWIAEQVNQRLGVIPASTPPKPEWDNVYLDSMSGKDTHRWQLVPVGNDASDNQLYKIVNKASKKVLDVTETIKAGTNVVVFKDSGTPGQRWIIRHVTHGEAAYAEIIPALNTKMLLSAEDNGVSSNNIKLWEDLHNSKQKFFLRQEANGDYYIIHTFTGKVLRA